MKPINTSIFDFPALITGGYVYVDKTAVLYEIGNFRFKAETAVNG